MSNLSFIKIGDRRFIISGPAISNIAQDGDVVKVTAKLIFSEYKEELVMSNVTSVILSFDALEEEDENGEKEFYWNMVRINAWLDARGYGYFGDVNDCAGGRKALQKPVFIAAFDHFEVESFCEFLRSLRWERPENVQVLVQGENERKFRLIEPLNF